MRDKSISMKGLLELLPTLTWMMFVIPIQTSPIQCRLLRFSKLGCKNLALSQTNLLFVTIKESSVLPESRLCCANLVTRTWEFLTVVWKSGKLKIVRQPKTLKNRGKDLKMTSMTIKVNPKVALILDKFTHMPNLLPRTRTSAKSLMLDLHLDSTEKWLNQDKVWEAEIFLAARTYLSQFALTKTPQLSNQMMNFLKFSKREILIQTFLLSYPVDRV